MTLAPETRRLNIISQNMFLDKTLEKRGLILSQDKRVKLISASIASFDGSLDVVGVQEAFKSKDQHNGIVLAESLGYEPGFWSKHNEKPYKESRHGRSNEFVGLFGAAVDRAEAIELGDNRVALLTLIADVAFVTFHLRAGHSLQARSARRNQIEALLLAIKQYDNAVAFGDLNEPPLPFIAAGRDKLRDASFKSVFTLTGQPRPYTFPSEPYRDIHGGRLSIPLDDILVRGNRVEVLVAGVLRTIAIEAPDKVERGDGVPLAGTDHDAPWATISVSPQI